MSRWRRSDAPETEPVPHHGRSQLMRGLLGGLIVFALTAGATATAGLLEVSKIVKELKQGGPSLSSEGITPAEAGSPQTILVLGSDRRWDDLKRNNKALRQDLPARSDTVMLIRLDPSQAATSILSLPRDLKVEIPGKGTDKLNAAYSYGGPTLTLKTIKAYTGLQINHVVNVNFRGFRDVVNAIGCVYVDVDRRYYNSNFGKPVGQRYAEINLQPGYQKLCGTDALSFVRYRHTDSDIVRAARQQAFLRQMKDQLSSSSLIDKRDKLVAIFGRNTQSDKALTTTNGVLRILKLALFSAGRPVRQVPFPAQYTQERLSGGAIIDYVTASRAAVRRTVQQFLHPARQLQSRPQVQLTPARKRRAPARRRGTADAAGLVDAQRSGENLIAPAITANPRFRLPIYFPRLVTRTSRYDNPGVRLYTLHDRAGKLRRAYRLVLVVNPVEGQYWGVQGTDWPTPPILHGTHTFLRRGGRKLGIYKDGSRIRLVSWRTSRGVYWVSNTLSDALTNEQMIGIAASLTRRFGR